MNPRTRVLSGKMGGIIGMTKKWKNRSDEDELNLLTDTKGIETE